MFFLLSKLLAVFTVPFTYIMLGMLLALLLYRKPRISKTCLILAVILLVLFGTPFLPNLLTRQLETAYDVPNSLPHVDAIIVLSGMLYLEKSSPEYLEFNESVERIVTGMQLMREGVGDILIISGGSGDLYNQDYSEAVFLRQFAIDFGIPEEKIQIEPDSRNTYENAVHTKALMDQHGLSSSILITTAIHLPRSVGCFHKVGLQPIPYPVDFILPPDAEFRFSDLIPGIGNLVHTTRIFHEYIGLLMYKLSGYL